MTSRSIASGYLLTIVFCIAIALLLWVLGVSDLQASLIVSLCIGLSINTAFVLFQDRLEQFMPAYLAPIPIQIGGLGFGLIAGAWITLDDPWFFFRYAQTTVMLGLFFGVTGYLIFGTRARLADTNAQLALAQQETADQERQLANTQLKLLQAQIEPHFLFNTISNASSLIHSDPDAAEATLENLSVLLRASLGRTREADTTVGQELNFLEAYLKIAKIRMGDRLQFTVAVDPVLHGVRLPPLLLQPLAENAVVHGIEPKPEGGTINISGTLHDDQLLLRVTDSGVGMGNSTAHSDQHNGTALTNIRERLRALYGERGQLRLLDNAESGVTAELSIPAGDH
ncbi:MAG: sensor histidine kinase [Pseudomonadales bacterium]